MTKIPFLIYLNNYPAYYGGVVGLNIKGSSPKELVDEKDSRGQGFKDSSEMLKALIKSLENKHLNPRILYHFLPTNREKSHKFVFKNIEKWYLIGAEGSKKSI